MGKARLDENWWLATRCLNKSFWFRQSESVKTFLKIWEPSIPKLYSCFCKLYYRRAALYFTWAYSKYIPNVLWLCMIWWTVVISMQCTGLSVNILQTNNMKCPFFKYWKVRGKARRQVFWSQTIMEITVDRDGQIFHPCPVKYKCLDSNYCSNHTGLPKSWDYWQIRYTAIYIFESPLKEDALHKSSFHPRSLKL